MSRRSVPRGPLFAWGRWTVGVALLFACAPAQSARGQPEQGPQSTIEVWGTGEVETDPDRARIGIGVEVLRAESVEAARSRAARAMNAMLEALDEAQIPDTDRMTTALRIQPEYAYEQGKRRLRGYTARHSLQVLVTDLSNVSNVVDGALSAGKDAARLGGISFELSDREAAESKARAAAVAQAKKRAEELAVAAGVQLGPAISIRETDGASGPRPPPMARAMMAEGDRSTPVATGQVRVEVRVQIVWAIRP
jgi:uncharacterized protein